MHRIINDPTNIPVIFSGALTLVSEIHSYNTRFASKSKSFRPSICNKL